MSALVVPDRVGEPIRAYRMWQLSSNRRIHRRYTSSIPNDHFGSLLPFNYPKITLHWDGRRRHDARCAAWDEDGSYYEHDAPHPDCRCGVHGLKRLDWVEEPLLNLLAEKLNRYAAMTRRGPARGEPQESWLVVGSVSLWGKVIEGTWGYRAQHAYPEMLWLLPPARLGGADKTAISDETVTLARDLLIALRDRYGCPVGYAGHGAEVSRLLGLDETGWFFSWRLSASGSDRFGRMLGDVGLPTVALPTIRDALDLWLTSRPGGASYEDRRLVREHLSPAFGHISIDRADEIFRVDYAPVSTVTGQPFHPRTIARHRNVVARAIDHAREQWLISDLSR